MLVQHGRFSIVSPHCRSQPWHLKTWFSENMPPYPCIVPINGPQDAWSMNIVPLHPLDIIVSRFKLDKQSWRLDHPIVHSQNWWFSTQPEVSISPNQTFNYLQIIAEWYINDSFAFSLRGYSKPCHDSTHEYQIYPLLDMRRTKESFQTCSNSVISYFHHWF